jgi:hypothetical protein
MKVVKQFIFKFEFLRILKLNGKLKCLVYNSRYCHFMKYTTLVTHIVYYTSKLNNYKQDGIVTALLRLQNVNELSTIGILKKISTDLIIQTFFGLATFT